MRKALKTAPRDGEVVILENEASGTYDVAYWRPEAREWIGRNGKPSKIAATHWHPISHNQHLLQEGKESNNPSQLEPSVRRRSYTHLALVIVAVVFGLVCYGIRDADQPDLAKTSMINEQVGAQRAQLPGQTSKTTLPPFRQTEANHARASVEVQQAEEVRAADAPKGQQPRKEDRAQTLTQELSEARRTIERLEVQARTEAKETAAARQELTRTVAKYRQEERERRASHLNAVAEKHRQALDEERARNAQLATIETQVAQLQKAREEIEQLRHVVDANSALPLDQTRQKMAALAQEAATARQELTISTATHRQSLEEERARSAQLASELATTQRKIETQAAQLRKRSEETAQLKQAETAKRERQKTAALAQEAEAARQELITNLAQHRTALDEERARSSQLASELATTRRQIETQAALLRKAGDETEQIKQAEAANSALSLEQERQKTAALAQEAEAARQELTTNLAQHRTALDEERVRRASMWSALTMAQHGIETQAALLPKVGGEATPFERAVDSAMADLRPSLQLEFDKTEALARDLEFVPRTIDGRPTLGPGTNSQLAQVTGGTQAPVEQPLALGAQDNPEETRLVARARTLLDQGNIGAARIVLERAVETGSAKGSFMLAETYDPVILSAWRTYGTRGEAAKARELYARAHAGGVLQAKDRLKALD